MPPLMLHQTQYLIILLGCWYSGNCSPSTHTVFEIESDFQQLNNGSWFVNFYAPWCGYCKRLHPIYTELAVVLNRINSPVQVARIDAYKYKSTGDKYSVGGYPTLKYLNDGHVITYNGERTVRSMAVFVVRQYGQAVKTVTSTADLEHNITFFQSDPYFVLFSPTARLKLQSAFHDAAGRFRSLSWFISTTIELLPKHLIERLPDDSDSFEIVVFKDELAFSYVDSPTHEPSMPLVDWILRERSPAFAHYSLTDLWEFGYDELDACNAASTPASDEKPPTHHLIALFLTRENHLSPLTDEFIALGRSLTFERLPELHKYFVFGWGSAHVGLSSLTLVDLVVPCLVAIDPISQLIYLHPNNSGPTGLYSLERDVIIGFLREVATGQVKAYGGNTIAIRFYRLIHGFFFGSLRFIHQHPLIALLMFCLPSLCLTGVVYFCCCLDDHYVMEEIDEDPGRPIIVECNARLDDSASDSVLSHRLPDHETNRQANEHCSLTQTDDPTLSTKKHQ